MPDFALSTEASRMETNDPIPLFLSNPIEIPEQTASLRPWERAVTASRILTTGIWFVTAAAIVFAVLSVTNPLALFENATASLFAKPAPHDGTSQSMPIIQSTADTQVLPPTASKAPTGDEIAATLKTADQSQTDTRQPSPEALLNQFQARAAEEDAEVQVRPVQPVQDAQAQLVQNARAKVVKNARAQLQRARNRAQIRPEQNARHRFGPCKMPRHGDSC